MSPNIWQLKSNGTFLKRSWQFIIHSVVNDYLLFLGFPAAAAYAAYAGRGYTGYPGFGLPGGIAGYPAGKYLKNLHVNNRIKHF